MMSTFYVLYFYSKKTATVPCAMCTVCVFRYDIHTCTAFDMDIGHRTWDMGDATERFGYSCITIPNINAPGGKIL